MPANPKSDAITGLRTAATKIIAVFTAGRSARTYAGLLLAAQGKANFDAGDFVDKNSDLSPADYTALLAALDSLSLVFQNADGSPTAAFVAVNKFANSPDINV